MRVRGKLGTAAGRGEWRELMPGGIGGELLGMFGDLQWRQDGGLQAGDSAFVGELRVPGEMHLSIEAAEAAPPKRGTAAR